MAKKLVTNPKIKKRKSIYDLLALSKIKHKGKTYELSEDDKIIYGV